MKCSIVFLAATLIATLSLAYSDSDEELRAEYCSSSMLADSSGCIGYECNKNKTKIIAKTCSESRCRPGTQIGYKEEKDKSYPDCCPHPICSNDPK